MNLITTVREPDYARLHPRFALVRDYLAGIAPPGRLPRRQHVDPIALRTVLPYLVLVDVVRARPNLRFRARLVGSEHVEQAASQFTGKYVEDVVGVRFLDRVVTNMRLATKQKRPHYDRLPLPFPQRDFLEVERICFPLAADGETVDILLIVNDYPGEAPLFEMATGF